MKNVIANIMVLLLLISTLAIGQDSESSSEVSYFKGGKYDVNFGFSNNLFLGVGSHVGCLGGDLGGVLPKSESILWNPANLAFVEHSQWSLDISPSIIIDPASFYDGFDEEIETGVDDALIDMVSDSLKNVIDGYPDLSIKSGLLGSFGTGSFAMKMQNLTIGGAIHQPFNLTLDMVGAGLAMKIESPNADEPALSVSMFSGIDLSMKTQIRMHGWSAGAAYNISPQWGVGVSMEGLSGFADVNARFQIDGIMKIAGNESAFNNPNDPWNNTLNDKIAGTYEGNSLGFKLGTTYKLNKSWGIGLVFSIVNDLKMKGDMEVVQYTMPGLNLEADESKGEEILDPMHEDFDLSETTKTIFVENPTSKLLLLKLPSSMGLGISGKAGFLRMSLNYIRYFGEVAYQYKFMRNDIEVNYSRGVDLTNGFRFGFDLRIFRIGAGVMMGKEINSTLEEGKKLKSIMIPSFVLGTGFHITKRMSTDIVLIAAPAGVGKITLHYLM